MFKQFMGIDVNVRKTEKSGIRILAEEVGQLLAKHHGKFAYALPIGVIHALTSAK